MPHNPGFSSLAAMQERCKRHQDWTVSGMPAWVRDFSVTHRMHVQNNSADGNCAPESVAGWLRQINHVPVYTHQQIRKMVFEHATNPTNGHIYGDDDMLQHLHKDGEYCGDGWMAAAAHCLQVDIILITNYPACAEGIMVFSCRCQNRPCAQDCAHYVARRPHFFIGHNHTNSLCDHFVALLPDTDQTPLEAAQASTRAETARTAKAGSKRPLYDEDECKDLYGANGPSAEPNSAAANSEEEADSDDMESEPECLRNIKPRPQLTWSDETLVRGWPAVLAVLLKHSQQGCECATLVSRSGYRTAETLVYRYQCAFANVLMCEWQLEVRIPFDQATAGMRFAREHPTTIPPKSTDLDFDKLVYNDTTMTTVPVPVRPAVHANHVCGLSIANQHSGHYGYQARGAHCLWVAYVSRNPILAMGMSRSAILAWLNAQEICCVHRRKDAAGVVTETDQLNVMANKCKRHCENKNRTGYADHDVNIGYDGQLLSLCHQFGLGAVAKHHGAAGFSCHTTYIIPGWRVGGCGIGPSTGTGELCILVSSFNLALNLSRATKWYKGRVTLAIDHTFKVSACDRKCE
jgi:hypothetical protein